MGFIGRLRTGWTLATDSVHVLRDEPSLTAFPIIAGIAGTIYIALILGGATVLTGPDPSVLLYGVLFIGYLGSSFIAAFFTAALMYNARQVFHGRDPTMQEGLTVAWQHKQPLLVWAIVSAIVGVIFRIIESQDNPLAGIAALIFSVAWGILTYFVIPVIVFENVNVTEMFTRSGETFKETWGETAGAGFGVGLVSVAFTLIGLLIAGLIFILFGSTTLGVIGGLIIAIIAVLAAVILGTTLTGIAKTALYVYATEGKRPRQFENVDFSTALR